MRDKMKKTLGILLMTACLGTAFVGCGEGTLDYEGDSLDGYVSEATVSSNGGFAVEKGEYVYFINGQEVPEAANNYGEVVKGSLMRIKKSELVEGDYTNVKTVVPALFCAMDYTAGIFIYGDYVYYATPTTDTTDSGEQATSYLDFKKAKLDGSEGPSKDYFLRLPSNTNRYRFVKEGNVVYCVYEDNGALKSVNTETKEVSTLVSGAKSAFFFDAKNPENPNVYYTMSVTAEDGSAQSYDQVYRVNAAATAKADKDIAKYTVYNEKGLAIKEYDFDEADMEAKNKEAKENKAEEPYDLSDYSTYPYVNLGELVLDGIGSGGEKYIPQTQYNWDSKEAADERDGYTYTLGQDCYQNGKLYFTRSKVGAKTDSDGTDTKLYYLADATTNAEDWNTVTGNQIVSESIVALKTANAATGAALYYEDGAKQYYIYVANNNLYKAGYDNDTDKEIEAIRIADGVGAPTLWKLDEANTQLYFYVDNGNGCSLSRVNYGGDADAYNSLHGDKNYQVVTLDYLVFNADWYKPEIFGDTVLYSGAQSFGEATFDYIYATKMGSVEEIEKANEAYNEVQDKINSYSSYADLQKALQYYYRTGERDVFDEFKDQYSESKIETFDKFVKLFDEGGAFYGKRESDLAGQVGKTSDADKDAMKEAWRTTLRKYLLAEEEETSEMASWLKWLLIGVGVGVVAAGIVTTVVVVNKKKAKKAEAEATVNAYKRKKIDTTDDKSIDVYAEDEAAEENEAQEETVADVVEETTEETVESESAEKSE